MIKTAGVHDYIEINAGIAKGVESHGWFDFYIFVNLFQNLFGNLDGYAFYLIEVAVIGNANRDADDDVAAGHAEVCDVGRGNFLIWYDYHIGVASRNDGRETPGDICNAAFFSSVQADIITDAQLFGKDQMQSGEDIRQGFLQREGYGHTTDTEGCQDWGNGNSVVLEDDQKSHGINDTVDDCIQ